MTTEEARLVLNASYVGVLLFVLRHVFRIAHTLLETVAPLLLRAVLALEAIAKKKDRP